MSLHFKILVDALKLPPPLARGSGGSSTSALFRYQVTWSAGRQEGAEGATLALTATESEVLFHHEINFRAAYPPDRLLQLNVFQIRNAVSASGSPRLEPSSAAHERNLVGVLVIDLNAHVPKTGQSTSKQRATLAVSLCPYDPPLMLRLAVESTKHHLPFDAEVEERRAEAQRRSASRAKSPSLPRPEEPPSSSGSARPEYATAAASPYPGAAASQSGQVPSLPLQQLTYRSPQSLPATGRVEDEDLLRDDKLESARLKAAIHSLSQANRQLRDENILLRNAAQRAREEPKYTYTYEKSGAGAPKLVKGGGGTVNDNDVSTSPAPRPPTADSAITADAHTILQAEIAVLQRGLQAAKDKIRQLEGVEVELRGELQSMQSTHTFQLEDIQRLEEEVHRLTQQRSEVDEQAVLDLRRSASEAHAKARVLAAELQTEERLRAKLNEEFKSLKRDYDAIVRRRHEAEVEERLRRDAHQEFVKKLEGRLEQAQKDIERMHKIAADANERCQAVAAIVESQSKIIDNKNKKIRSLQALLEAHEVVKKLTTPSSTAGADPAHKSKKRTSAAATSLEPPQHQLRHPSTGSPQNTTRTALTSASAASSPTTTTTATQAAAATSTGTK